MKDTFYFSHDYSTRTDPKIKKLIQKHGMFGYGIFWSLVEDLYQNTNQLPADYDSIAFDLRVDAMLVESVINDFGLFRLSDGLFSSDSVARRIEVRMDKIEKAKKSAEARWNKIKNDATAKQTHLPTYASAVQGLSDGNAIKETNENTEKKTNENIEKDNKGKNTKQTEDKQPNPAIAATIADKGENFPKKFSGTRTFTSKNNNSLSTNQPSGVDTPRMDIPRMDIPGMDIPGVDAPGMDIPATPGQIGDGTLQKQCRRFSADNKHMYPPKMYVDFLLYWTAPVQNGKKSEIGKEKWRIQETFQIASRLSTWFSKNPKQYQNNGTNSQSGLNAPKHLGATAVFPDDKDYSGRK